MLKYRSKKWVGKKVKIVIAGIGKFGDYLTRQLVNQNNEITVIDINFDGKETCA